MEDGHDMGWAKIGVILTGLIRMLYSGIPSRPMAPTSDMG